MNKNLKIFFAGLGIATSASAVSLSVVSCGKNASHPKDQYTPQQVKALFDKTAFNTPLTKQLQTKLTSKQTISNLVFSIATIQNEDTSQPSTTVNGTFSVLQQGYNFNVAASYNESNKTYTFLNTQVIKNAYTADQVKALFDKSAFSKPLTNVLSSKLTLDKSQSIQNLKFVITKFQGIDTSQPSTNITGTFNVSSEKSFGYSFAGTVAYNEIKKDYVFLTINTKKTYTSDQVNAFFAKKSIEATLTSFLQNNLKNGTNIIKDLDVVTSDVKGSKTNSPLANITGTFNVSSEKSFGYSFTASITYNEITQKYFYSSPMITNTYTPDQTKALFTDNAITKQLNTALTAISNLPISDLAINTTRVYNNENTSHPSANITGNFKTSKTETHTFTTTVSYDISKKTYIFSNTTTKGSAIIIKGSSYNEKATTYISDHYYLTENTNIDLNLDDSPILKTTYKSENADQMMDLVFTGSVSYSSANAKTSQTFRTIYVKVSYNQTKNTSNINNLYIQNSAWLKDTNSDAISANLSNIIKDNYPNVVLDNNQAPTINLDFQNNDDSGHILPIAFHGKFFVNAISEYSKGKNEDMSKYNNTYTGTMQFDTRTFLSTMTIETTFDDHVKLNKVKVQKLVVNYLQTWFEAKDAPKLKRLTFGKWMPNDHKYKSSAPIWKMTGEATPYNDTKKISLFKCDVTTDFYNPGKLQINAFKMIDPNNDPLSGYWPKKGVNIFLTESLKAANLKTDFKTPPKDLIPANIIKVEAIHVNSVSFYDSGDDYDFVINYRIAVTMTDPKDPSKTIVKNYTDAHITYNYLTDTKTKAKFYNLTSIIIPSNINPVLLF